MMLARIVVFVVVVAAVVFWPFAAFAQPQEPDTGGDLVTEVLKKSLTSVEEVQRQSLGKSLQAFAEQFSAGFSPKVDGLSTAGDWFAGQYQMMMNIGFWVMIPILLVGTIHAVASGSIQLLVRMYAVYLPLSIIGAWFATDLMQVLLHISDDMTAVFNRMTGDDLALFLSHMAMVRVESLFDVVVAILLGGFIFAAAAGILLVLALRDASVYLATMLLPVGFATLVWPVLARHLRRMIELLVGLIFSKPIMAAVLSLAMAAINGGANAPVVDFNGTLVESSGAIGMEGAGDAVTGWGAFTTYMAPALTLMLMLCIVPSLVLRLVGNIGLGETAGVAAGVFGRDGAIMPFIFFNRAKSLHTKFTSTIPSTGKMVRDKYEQARHTSNFDYQLARMGLTRDESGYYGTTSEGLRKAGVDDDKIDSVMAMWDSRNDELSITQVAAGETAHQMGSDFAGFQEYDGAIAVRSKTGRSVMISDLDNQGGSRFAGLGSMGDELAMRQLSRAIVEEARVQEEQFGSVKGLAVFDNLEVLTYHSDTFEPWETSVGMAHRRTRRQFENTELAIGRAQLALIRDGIAGADQVNHQHMVKPARGVMPGGTPSRKDLAVSPPMKRVKLQKRPHRPRVPVTPYQQFSVRPRDARGVVIPSQEDRTKIRRRDLLNRIKQDKRRPL